jgi:uncharacterized Tic20 family protein
VIRLPVNEDSARISEESPPRAALTCRGLSDFFGKYLPVVCEIRVKRNRLWLQGKTRPQSLVGLSRPSNHRTLNSMTLADEIHKLDQLRQSGALTDEDYVKAKARVLDGAPAVPNSPAFFGTAGQPADVEHQTRLWAMILHLSLLAGYVVPLGGLVVPIVIWQLMKNELPGLDAHGKVVANWIISLLIYGIVAGILCVVLIGIPLLITLALLHVVFPIIGGVKANNGEVWRYPLSISFLT